MKSNCSAGAQKRWKNIPPDERSKIMSERRRKGWEKVSPEKRREHALKMVEGRKNKSK